MLNVQRWARLGQITVIDLSLGRNVDLINTSVVSLTLFLFEVRLSPLLSDTGNFSLCKCWDVSDCIVS